MIKVENLIGEAFLLPVETEVTERISGESELKFEFDESTYNRDIVNAISKKWRVKHVGGQNDDRIYVVAIVQKVSNAVTAKVSVVAKEKQIDDLKSQRVYDNHTGSYTGQSYFDVVFNGSGYKYDLIAKTYSSKWENAGDGETRLEMFKKGLERYGLEFEYVPSTKTFILKERVQREANYYIANGINALNFKLEEDSSEYYTYARGYGDYDDNAKFQEGLLEVTYVHPLADVVGRYEAPPIKDGRIKDQNLLRRKLRDLVDNSLKTSLSLDFISLKDSFPDAVVRTGDVIPVKDNVIGVGDMVRIVEVRTKRDVNNNIYEQEGTLGDYKRKDRYASLVNNSTNFVKGITGSPTNVNDTQSRVNSIIASTGKIIDLVNAMQVDGTGIKSVDKLNIVHFTSDKGTIRVSKDGGTTYKDVINGDGVLVDGIAMATQSKNGLMSKEDKTKLDNLNNVGSSQLGSIFYKEVK